MAHGRSARGGNLRLSRRLGFESLEDRRMLATITVTSLADNLLVNGQVTLREAILAAQLNVSVDGSTAGSSVGGDIIKFADNLNGPVKLLEINDDDTGLSSLVIRSEITIQGNAAGITISRDTSALEMRLFLVTAGGNLTLDSLTLADGVGRGYDGVAGSPNGQDGLGGAILNQGTLTVSASTLANNRSSGGNAASGGNGGSGLGGAIYNDGGHVTIRNATLSGNSTQVGTGASGGNRFGGGVYGRNGSLAIYNSTITNNSATTGRGVYVVGVGGTASASIYSSIIGSADLIAGYELFASFDSGGTIQIDGANNLIRKQNDFLSLAVSTDDPLLEPLGANGGPTMTHALAVGSPAINQGVNPLNLSTDQRTATFIRVANGGVDIGAFERQTSVGPALPGDYNGNSVVDASDFVVWRKMRDLTVTAYSGADGNGDSHVDSADYGVWRGSFGRTLGAASVTDAELEPSNAISVEAPEAGQFAERAVDSAAIPLMAREEVFSSIPAFDRQTHSAPAKMASISPAHRRYLLELVLVDSVGRRPQPAAHDSSLEVGCPDDAPAALASDELLADWLAADACAVSF